MRKEKNVYAVVNGLSKMLDGEIRVKIDDCFSRPIGVYETNTIPINVLGLDVFSVYFSWDGANDEYVYIEIVVFVDR